LQYNAPSPHSEQPSPFDGTLSSARFSEANDEVDEATADEREGTRRAAVLGRGYERSSHHREAADEPNGAGEEMEDREAVAWLDAIDAQLLDEAQAADAAFARALLFPQTGGEGANETASARELLRRPTGVHVDLT
jgi:hypothetical protein